MDDIFLSVTDDPVDEFYLMDDTIALMREAQQKASKSFPLPKRGTGSVYAEIRENGLVSLSHRYRNGKKMVQYHLGYHSSCYSDFSSTYPDKAYLTMTQAFVKVQENLTKADLSGSVLMTHYSEQAFKKREAQGFLSFRVLVEGYINHMEGRRSYENLKSALTKHILKNKRLPQSVLNKSACFIVYEDLTPVFNHMLYVRRVYTATDRLIAFLSAAYTWGAKYDKDSTIREKEFPGIFNVVGYNPFYKTPSFNKNPKVGKYQLTDKQLWLLWHESLACMSKAGRLARLLLTLGGVRQEHLLVACWADVDINTRYPNIELISAKSGNESKPFKYSIPFNSLALYELEQLRLITGHTEFLFPQERNRDRTMSKDGLDKPLARLQEHVLGRYGYTMPHLSMGMLRGTVSTRMGVIGIGDSIKEKIQGHNLNNIRTKHYDRNKMLPEKLEALTKWDEYLRDLLSRPYSEVFDVYPEFERLQEGEAPVVVARGL